MKARISTLCLLTALALAGCHSQSAPQFKLSANTDSLAPYASQALSKELEAGFGTPSSFMVWPQLPVDFGTYSGDVAKVLQIGAGSVVLAGDGLVPSTDLALESRLASLQGSAVIFTAAAEEPPAEESPAAENEPGAAAGDESESVPAEPTAVYRVASYDPETKTLQVVDADGAPAAIDAQEGDSIQVIGDGLQRGRDLYHRHCVHCHGSSGDGDGPTAKYFNVRPRDYRKGLFKFTSTKKDARASRDDLYRIIKLGAPGTYMPSFMLLPDDEVSAIVEYVRWLSMRGEMEGKLYVEFYLDHSKAEPAGKGEFNETWAAGAAEFIENAGDELNDDWALAEQEDQIVFPVYLKDNPEKKPVGQALPRTPYSPESIARGRKLFMGKSANCFSCHGEKGRGNGASTELRQKLPSGELAEKPGLFDAWGNKVKPRNLTMGIYRGGRRPIDIYRRINAGIKGTPMPPAGGTLTPDQTWDLVNYVLSIPTHK